LRLRKYNEALSENRNLDVIVSISTLITLLIAGFGLFDLTLFTAKLRTKEIGIKNVFPFL
jgi:ABC-type antimicrobial peptide transport system permease subunit